MDQIFITGISTGIGYDTTRHLLSIGYFVHGSVRKLEDKDRLLKEFPDNLAVYIFDVTDKDQINAAAAKLKGNLNGQSLLALINNAGYAEPGPQLFLPDDSFRKQMEVNLFGVRNVCNALLPFLGASLNFKGKPGRIINISSVSGIFNTPFMGSYCVSKHALESLSEVYRRELMLYNIDVVCINPGPVLSEIWDKNLGKLDPFLDTDYHVAIKKADEIIEMSKDEALPLSYVSKQIQKTIESKKPKLNQVLHKSKLGFNLLRRLPRRWVDKIIYNRMMGDKIRKLR